MLSRHSDRASSSPPPGGSRLPLLEARDIGYCVVLPLLAVIAWLAPQAMWRAISAFLVRALFLGPDKLGKPLKERIEAAASAEPGLNARGIAESYVRNKLILQFEYFRCLRPGGWSCNLQLQGREYLDTALEDGRGAILWVTPSSSSDLVVKRCMSENGIAVSHLSALTHGYAESRFGVAAINSINRTVENRYLEKRIILDRRATRGAVRELERRVRANEIVSITAVENKGGRSAEIVLFSGRLPLGVGAISIAYNTGSSILPVFCVREAGEGKIPTYVVSIGAPLKVDATKGKREAFADTLRRFGRLVEAHASAVPDQWQGWTHLRTSAPKAARARSFWDWLHKTPRNDGADTLSGN